MSAILDFAGPIVNKILSYIPDPEQKLKAQEELMTGFQAWDAQQTQINAAEASNENVFVSGWRPFIGWVCGIAFAYKFILMPFMAFILVACHVDFDVDSLPVLDWSEMSTVLLGLLGLGGMRSWEKINGVTK